MVNIQPTKKPIWNLAVINWFMFSEDFQVKKRKMASLSLEAVKSAEKVFLHKNENKWYVVRPFDEKQAELNYSDPCLDVVQKQTRDGTIGLIIIDSETREPNTTPIYAHKVLKRHGVPAVGTALMKCSMFLPTLRHISQFMRMLCMRIYYRYIQINKYV